MDTEIQDIIDRIRNETDPFSKARLLYHVTKEKNIRVKDLAQLLSTSSAYLCNLMRIRLLPDIVVDGFYSKNVSLTHLLVLSRLKDVNSMVSVYEIILQNSLPVAGVEELVRAKLYGISSNGNRINQEEIKKIDEVFKKIDSDIGVSVTQTRVKATVKLVSKGNFAKTSQILKKLAESKLVK